MGKAFHYSVKAKLIRYKTKKEMDFVEYEQIFENGNPIAARKEAFNHYQSMIDVLLQGIKKVYHSDKQIRDDLKSFLESGTSTKIKIGDKEFEISNSSGNGIGVFFIIDKPIDDVPDSIKDSKGDEWLIHGVGSIGGFSDPQTLMDGLDMEYSYYEYYKYETLDYKRTINFYEYDIDKTEPNEILDTPYDWSGFDRPY